ncbi:MAG: hypothetical protein Q9M91_07610 [Candidatus Dojkabacteria bacterium]|nr:hypothetical protein [Candidatus Dojkabacteria bacterium]
MKDKRGLIAVLIIFLVSLFLGIILAVGSRSNNENDQKESNNDVGNFIDPIEGIQLAQRAQRDTQRRASLNEIQLIIYEYQSDFGKIPKSSSELKLHLDKEYSTFLKILF